MEKKALWAIVVVLVAVNLWLLTRQQGSEATGERSDRVSRQAVVGAAYTDEEEALVNRVRVVPEALVRHFEKRSDSGGLDFILIVSADDCTNCIEDEVSQLNRIARETAEEGARIQGFFLDEGALERTRSVISHLSPTPQFPIRIESVLGDLPASTPLVLVVRSRDGRILDAHKPLPENLSKRDAFYVRWNAALGIG